MPSLVNKNKLTLCTTAFFLSSMSSQAFELRLNGSSSFDIIGAGYVDVLSGELLVSELSSEKIHVILNADAKAETQAEIKIKFNPNEAIKLFWNDQPIGAGKSDSQWLFFHGPCNKTQKLFIERQPDDSITVAPDNNCKNYRDFKDWTATKLIIQRQIPLSTLPNKQDSIYFSPNVLDKPFDLSFFDPGISMSGKTGSDLFTHQKLALEAQKHPLLVEQQAFLADPASYSRGEITVFLASHPISGRTLKDLPASAMLNALVDLIDSVDGLFNLIIQAMTELEYIRSDANPFQITAHEIAREITDHDDGSVNVQLVRNYIKKLLRTYNPPESPLVIKGSINESVKKIIHKMSEIKGGITSVDHDSEEQPDSGEGQHDSGEEPVAGATGYSELTSDQEAVVERLIYNHQNKSYLLLHFLGPLTLKKEFKQLNFDEIKLKIKGKGGSINSDNLHELMRTSSDFERLLQQADKELPRGKRKGGSQNSGSTEPDLKDPKGPKASKGPKGPKGSKYGKKPDK